MFKGGKGGTRWCDSALVGTYRAGMRSPVIEELGRAVDESRRAAGEPVFLDEVATEAGRADPNVDPWNAPGSGIRDRR